MASYSKISEMFDANPFILRLLVNSETLSQARRDLIEYINL
jgi:lysine 2,3-aminomutase